MSRLLSPAPGGCSAPAPASARGAKPACLPPACRLPAGRQGRQVGEARRAGIDTTPDRGASKGRRRPIPPRPVNRSGRASCPADSRSPLLPADTAAWRYVRITDRTGGRFGAPAAGCGCAVSCPAASPPIGCAACLAVLALRPWRRRSAARPGLLARPAPAPVVTVHGMQPEGRWAASLASRGVHSRFLGVARPPPPSPSPLPLPSPSPSPSPSPKTRLPGSRHIAILTGIDTIRRSSVLPRAKVDSSTIPSALDASRSS